MHLMFPLIGNVKKGILRDLYYGLLNRYSIYKKKSRERLEMVYR